MSLPEDLLDILACPDCHEPVVEEGETLVCQGCGLIYPVRDGVPIMLIDEATRPEESK